MSQGAGLEPVLGPLGHDALAGRHPLDVLERGVCIDADGVALVVWAPDPQLVLEPTLEDPVMLLLPGLLAGPCQSQDTGELSGAPLGLVGQPNLAKGCLLLLVDPGLPLQDVLLEAGQEVGVQGLEEGCGVWHDRDLQDLVPGEKESRLSIPRFQVVPVRRLQTSNSYLRDSKKLLPWLWHFMNGRFLF